MQLIPHFSSSQPLYEILDPSRFTLLVADGESTADIAPTWEKQLHPWFEVLRTYRIAPAFTQQGAKVQFDRFFGSGQSLLLVRPDSYLGFVGDWNALPALTEWLSRWFSPPAN